MNIHRAVDSSLRESMAELVPPEGAILTAQLAYRIKKGALDRMKVKGYDLTAHKHAIRLEFIRPDAPNLVIPPNVMARFLH